jgi:hypothetical protein
MILLPDTPGLASMMASAFTALLSLLNGARVTIKPTTESLPQVEATLAQDQRGAT